MIKKVSLFVLFVNVFNANCQIRISYSKYDYDRLCNIEIIDSSIQSNGSIVLFSKDSFLYLKGQFYESKKVGEWVYFFKNGGIKKRQIYPMNKKYYISEFYYLNGGKKEEWFRNQQSDMRDSIYISWYENGIMKWRFNFKDDELNGLFQEWDSLGNLRIESIYCSNKYATENCNCMIIYGRNGETFDISYPTIWYQNGRMVCVLVKDSSDTTYYTYNEYDCLGKLTKTTKLSKEIIEVGGAKVYFYKPVKIDIIDR